MIHFLFDATGTANILNMYLYLSLNIYWLLNLYCDICHKFLVVVWDFRSAVLFFKRASAYIAAQIQ